MNDIADKTYTGILKHKTIKYDDICTNIASKIQLYKIQSTYLCQSLIYIMLTT